MHKVKPIQKAEWDGDENAHPNYLRDDSSPDNVMYRMQGPLRLDKPLKSDGSADTGKQSC